MAKATDGKGGKLSKPQGERRPKSFTSAMLLSPRVAVNPLRMTPLPLLPLHRRQNRGAVPGKCAYMCRIRAGFGALTCGAHCCKMRRMKAQLTSPVAKEGKPRRTSARRWSSHQPYRLISNTQHSCECLHECRPHKQAILQPGLFQW